ncbi:hypothetical protein K438DRAFT_2028739, partial [Mycena galopus ATCC 62051]
MENPATESDKDRDRDRESAAELTLALRHLSSELPLTDGSLATVLASLASAKAQNRVQTLAVEQTYTLAARLCAQVEERLQCNKGLKEEAERGREVKRAREEAQRTDAVSMQRWCASSRGAATFSCAVEDELQLAYSEWERQQHQCELEYADTRGPDAAVPLPFPARVPADGQTRAHGQDPTRAQYRPPRHRTLSPAFARALAFKRTAAQTQLATAQRLIAELGAELSKVEFKR